MDNAIADRIITTLSTFATNYIVGCKTGHRILMTERREYNIFKFDWPCNESYIRPTLEECGVQDMPGVWTQVAERASSLSLPIAHPRFEGARYVFESHHPNHLLMMAVPPKEQAAEMTN